MPVAQSGPTSGSPARISLLAWLILGLISLLLGAGNIAEGRFPDPDDTLRLVQVRDLLGGQGWFDLHQYRMNPPTGTLMHWSRLVDVPLAVLIAALTPMLGARLAEQVTLVAMPLLTLGAILFVIARIAFEKFDRDTTILACLCLGLIPTLLFQLQPNRIDHHGLQALMVATALWAMTRSSARRGGAVAGLAMAAGTIVSIEMLPMAAAFGVVFALRWLRDPSQSCWLATYMATLASGLIALFLATRGIADLAPHCDVVAPAHLAFFAVTGAGTAAIARCKALGAGSLVVLLGLAGLAGIAAFVSIAPDCVASPFGTLSPLVRAFWFLNVLEGLPLWNQVWSEALPTMLQMLIGLAAAFAIWHRSSPEDRVWWLDYVILFSFAILAGTLTYRSMAFAGVVAAIPLGWLARQLLLHWRETRQPLRKIAMTLVICVVLLPSSPLAVASALAPASKQQNVLVEKSSCELSANASRLDRLAPGTVFAPLDIGPVLIQSTHHSVVATGHHRAKDAMHDVILAFISPPARAREVMARYRPDYLVACLDLAEPRLFAKGGGDASLMAGIAAGREPAWLEPVDLGTPEPLKVYRIVN